MILLDKGAFSPRGNFNPFKNEGISSCNQYIHQKSLNIKNCGNEKTIGKNLFSSNKKSTNLIGMPLTLEMRGISPCKFSINPLKIVEYWRINKNKKIYEFNGGGQWGITIIFRLLFRLTLEQIDFRKDGFQIILTNILDDVAVIWQANCLNSKQTNYYSLQDDLLFTSKFSNILLNFDKRYNVWCGVVIHFIILFILGFSCFFLATIHRSIAFLQSLKCN